MGQEVLIGEDSMRCTKRQASSFARVNMSKCKGPCMRFFFPVFSCQHCIEDERLSSHRSYTLCLEMQST